MMTRCERRFLVREPRARSFEPSSFSSVESCALKLQTAPAWAWQESEKLTPVSDGAGEPASTNLGVAAPVLPDDALPPDAAGAAAMLMVSWRLWVAVTPLAATVKV